MRPTTASAVPSPGAVAGRTRGWGVAGGRALTRPPAYARLAGHYDEMSPAAAAGRDVAEAEP